jgi:hypothetical protein
MAADQSRHDDPGRTVESHTCELALTIQLELDPSVIDFMSTGGRLP